MAKYLQLFDNAADLADVAIVTSNSEVGGSPWVGAESATHTVRYAPKGILESEQENAGSEEQA